MRIREGEAEGSDTLGGDASGTDALAAVGEYKGFAKLKALDSPSPATINIFCSI